jgi:sugar transferase (PEP-CTERM system associated)
MVRLFNVYYPARTLVLVGGEAIVVCASFLLACLIQFGPDSYLILNYENGFYKIFGISGMAMLFLHYFDLYDLQRLRVRGELYFRLLVVLGVLSLSLAGLGSMFPELMLGNASYLTGLLILTFGLVVWRSSYGWLLRQPFLRERVYVLGAGERAERLVEALRTRSELGMEVVGWAGALGNGSLTREELANRLRNLRDEHQIDRVIVALSNRRGTMPVRELLELRMLGIQIEDATGLLEKVTGKIEVDDLHPSWLIFSDGFRLSATFLTARRLFSMVVSLACLIVCLPLIPLIVLGIKLSSPGPALYRQRRVGRHGGVFTCYKFRTMRADAEADSGATWASDDDPRITRFGHLLRMMRLDEIPQFWNVLKGDMGFVGPRPERPEFVEQLVKEIPYYHLRHIIRPGITGWAQVNYGYGASVEDAKEKLRYDLYYIKNISLALDLLIIFQTFKTVLFGRGAR